MKSVYEDSKVLGERKYKAGYIVQDEMVKCGDNNEAIKMKVAYTPDGKYIGNPRDAYRLCKARGIKPELRTPDSKTCSIGFCEEEQKWYGWSHRAIFGFGKGSKIKKGDCTAEYLPIGFIANNLGEAKTMASAFAQSVG